MTWSRLAALNRRSARGRFAVQMHLFNAQERQRNSIAQDRLVGALAAQLGDQFHDVVLQEDKFGLVAVEGGQDGVVPPVFALRNLQAEGEIVPVLQGLDDSCSGVPQRVLVPIRVARDILEPEIRRRLFQVAPLAERRGRGARARGRERKTGRSNWSTAAWGSRPRARGTRGDPGSNSRWPPTGPSPRSRCPSISNNHAWLSPRAVLRSPLFVPCYHAAEPRRSAGPAGMGRSSLCLVGAGRTAKGRRNALPRAAAAAPQPLQGKTLDCEITEQILAHFRVWAYSLVFVFRPAVRARIRQLLRPWP